MFFLTAADTERLNIRGSRDPLGFVPLWGTFGRVIVENLTTASNSVRGFTTLLLGMHFAQRVADGEEDPASERLSAFLKFEQLAGFARVLRNRDESMRGITQIKRRIQEGGSRGVRIGASQELQILANQKTYGLWGLFIMPAIESGLLTSRDLELTRAARELVEGDYLTAIREHVPRGDAIIEGLLSGASATVQPDQKHAKLFDALGEILAPTLRSSERRFYHYHLVRGGPKAELKGWQPRFVEVMEQVLPKPGGFDRASLEVIIASLRGKGDAPLREHLVRISDLEQLLVTVANLFGFLQQRDSAAVGSVVMELRKTWGKGLRYIAIDAIAEMRPEISGVFDDSATGERIVELAAALREGEFEHALDLVLAHNGFVMNVRNGSQPWIRRAGKKLEVNYRDETARELLPPSSLASAWQNTFYIDPLKLVSDQVRRTR